MSRLNPGNRLWLHLAGHQKNSKLALTCAWEPNPPRAQALDAADPDRQASRGAAQELSPTVDGELRRKFGRIVAAVRASERVQSQMRH